MKNKKGFTLIELLVTISLLATLSVIVGVNVNTMLLNQQEKERVAYKQKLEDAACVYVDHIKFDASTCSSNSAGCQIKFKALINEGLIEGNIVNPDTKVKIKDDTNSYVQIGWSNNEKTCTYVEK